MGRSERAKSVTGREKCGLSPSECWQYHGRFAEDWDYHGAKSVVEQRLPIKCELCGTTAIDHTQMNCQINQLTRRLKEDKTNEG